MHKAILIIALIWISILTPMSTFAQGCAQCKAQVESSESNELSVGNGLNEGIMILMVAPYVLLAIIPLVIFRKKFFRFLRDFTAMWKS